MISWLRVLVLRWMALFRKGRLEQELDEELRAHVEMQVDENARKGMSPQEARCAAVRSFGGVEQVKEIYREQRGLAMIETLVQDLRYGLRLLCRSPGFTALAVLSIALGIGVNTAIFTLIDAVLLKALAVKDPEQLVQFLQVNPNSHVSTFPYPHYEKYRTRTRCVPVSPLFFPQPNPHADRREAGYCQRTAGLRFIPACRASRVDPMVALRYE